MQHAGISGLFERRQGLVARLALAGTALCLLAPGVAGAETYEVTSFGDGQPGACTPADCTLREAIVAANDSSSKADTVRLRAGRYRLSLAPRGLSAADDDRQGDLDLGDDGAKAHGKLTIAGANARSTIVSGTSTLDDRVFEVESGDAAELRDLTVTGGRETNASVGGSSQGGGIAVEGRAGEGGDAKLSLRRVTVRGNKVVNGDGGGIDNNGILTILESTIRGNTALNGGAIEQDDTLTLQNSTLSGNVVEEEGGGIDNDGGDVETPTGPSDAERLVSSSTTIAFNRAENRRSTLGPGLGGGISNQSTSGPRDGLASFKNTIIANNEADGTGVDNCDRGAPQNNRTRGGNLENTAECSFEHTNANAALGPLADNLGPTSTHALYEGSRAIDRASACPSRDQRAVARTDPSGCDIGAFESRVGFSGDPCAAPDATIAGTSKSDVLRGTPGPDVIFAGEGGDRIYAVGGDDVVCAGAGRDLVLGGPADDRLDGAADLDRLYGGAGGDRLEGSSGDDLAFGEAGRDSLFGEVGNDALNGGSSSDVCRGGAGRNSLRACER